MNAIRFSRLAVLAVLSATLAGRFVSAPARGAPVAQGLPNAFFAMDTSTKDAAHKTPESQARLLKDLGYAGIGASAGQVPEMLAALDREGLKMFTVYIGVEIGGTNQQAPAPVVKLIEQLKGRDTMVWLFVTSKKYKPSDPAGDADAVPVLRDIADQARAANLKVALYPHTWFWLERIQDAVRLAKQVDRDNLGVTFNLCHCLKVGDEKKIPELLEQARPHLFVVSINGADHEGNWDRLIQTLDRGEFDVLPVLQKLKSIGFTGPIGFQGYGIKGDVRDNLQRTMEAWRRLSATAAR